MADSRRLLLSLIDRLLDNVRSAAAAAYKKSLGALVAEIIALDAGDAQCAAGYLKERGFAGHADRLTQDVDRLRQKADEAFRGPFVAELTAEDRKQEGYLFRSLRSDVHRLLKFLNELKVLVDQDGNSESDAGTLRIEDELNGPLDQAATNEPEPLNVKPPAWYEVQPPKDSRYAFGPIEGSLNDIENWLKAGTRPTLRKHNGVSWWYIRKVTGRWYEVWTDSDRKLADANARRLSATKPNESKRNRTRRKGLSNSGR